MCPVLQGRDVRGGVADASIFDSAPVEINGVKVERSIAKDFESHGVKWQPSQKGPGSRKQGWAKMRQLLRAAVVEPQEEPGLFVCESCTEFIRTVPVLERDDKDFEDVNSESEDHIADGSRYRCLELQLGKPRTQSRPRIAATYLPEYVRGW